MAESQIHIDVVAEDTATPVIQSSTTTINQAFTAMKNQQRQVQREFELSNQSFVAASRVINTVSIGVSRMLSIYNSWNLLQLRNQTAAQNVANAQTNVDDALIKFGKDSPEYVKALKEQKKALDDAKQAANDTAIGYVLMGLSIVTTITQMVTRGIPKINALRGAIDDAAKTVKSAGGVPGAEGPTLPATVTSRVAGLLKTSPETLAKFGKIGAGVGAGIGAGALTIAEMMGEQTAGAGTDELPGTGKTGLGPGADQLYQVGQDIYKKVTNIFHINGPNADQVAHAVIAANKTSSNYGN